MNVFYVLDILKNVVVELTLRRWYSNGTPSSSESSSSLQADINLHILLNHWNSCWHNYHESRRSQGNV